MTELSITVTVHVAFFLLNVVTVIFAVPARTPVTLPLASTVATFLLLLFQVSFFDAVLLGSFAVKAQLSPTGNCTFFSDSVTLLGAARTVTLQVAIVFFPDTTVIFAVPFFFAVITPFLLTVATDFFDVLHVTPEISKVYV